MTFLALVVSQGSHDVDAGIKPLIDHMKSVSVKLFVRKMRTIWTIAISRYFNILNVKKLNCYFDYCILNRACR